MNFGADALPDKSSSLFGTCGSETERGGKVPQKFFNGNFAEEYDVVVVGFGIAGAATAIEASDSGLSVLIVEKMDQPGGISVTSGGGFAIARDRDMAFAYLKALNRGTIDDALIAILANGMVELEDYFVKLSELNGASVSTSSTYGSYCYPGNDTFGYLQVDDVPGFDARSEWRHLNGGKGATAFKLFLDHVAAREIPVRLSTAAERLIVGADGDVRGVWIRTADEMLPVKARRGIVLACGGFEANAEMQRSNWPVGPARPVSFRGNTGDGIRMAVDVGAELWHMWHFHGAYGFHHPDPEYPFAIRTKELPNWAHERREPTVAMSWILVDQNGKRFMNEYQPYTQDTAHRSLDYIDLRAASTPRLPCFMIVDDAGRQMYRLGDPRFNDSQVRQFRWSDDNLSEIEMGLLKRFDTLEEVAVFIGCDSEVLRATIDDWNSICSSGGADPLGRPPATRMPVREPPYLVAEMWPVVSNTQGGPAHDALQRVLGPFGCPIDRLYVAGELGGAWGFLYLGGGNLSEAVIGGRIAARELAGLENWASA